MSVWAGLLRHRLRRGRPPHDSPARRWSTVARLLTDVAGLPPGHAAAALAYVRELRSMPVDAAIGTTEAELATEPLLPVEVAPAEVRARPTPVVDVRVLGPFEVALDGVPVSTWGGSRIRTVLQYLLLHDRPVRREILMELLWAGHTYRSARNNLNVCIYGLRRALGTGEEYVLYRDGSYCLNNDLDWSIDSARFVAFDDRARAAVVGGDDGAAIGHSRAAVDTYRGPLLEGEPSADWCAAEREALAERFRRTLQTLAELHLSAGEVEEAERVVQRLLRDDACRESAHRLLMICYARHHQLDLVARQFRRCIALLGDELDIAPSIETVRLYRELTTPAGLRRSVQPALGRSLGGHPAQRRDR